MRHFRVLVIGGYGFFGQRLVQRLTDEPALHIIIGRVGDGGDARGLHIDMAELAT